MANERDFTVLESFDELEDTDEQGTVFDEYPYDEELDFNDDPVTEYLPDPEDTYEEPLELDDE